MQDARETLQTFSAIFKNARSFSSDECFAELLEEMADSAWDVILLNETWREEAEELDTLDDRHVWCGSGGTKGKHGVGILVHQRWAAQVHRWRAINERIGVLELNLFKVKLSLIVVYMPHRGYADAEVQRMYDHLSNFIGEARRAKRVVIIGGDWNAEAQSAMSSGDSGAVGEFANPFGNDRGDWLVRWATAERLILCNTLFKKRWGKIWTHRQGDRERQIDYLCIDAKHRDLVRDAGVSRLLDLGSDHRAVKL
eukprot:1095156-Karenia_brevis.AAC.1